MRLTPIALAISSAFFMTTGVFAAGGSAGNFGQSLENTSNTNLVGDSDSGDPGGDAPQANGTDGGNIQNQKINKQGAAPSTPLTITGTQGGNGTNGYSTNADDDDGGAGGAGGHGGASAFGGFSIGGAAGNSQGASANGGAGGNVGSNSVFLSNVTLGSSIGVAPTGGFGGNGDSDNGGAGGDGGHGGGSVFGGLSSGGGGGSTSESVPSSSNNGGSGGAVTSNVITLNNVNLIGANGGKGGSTGDGNYYGGGGGGHGGHGGGSIFGGISSGGAGGFDEYSINSTSANGGAGGTVSGNLVTVTSTAANFTFEGQVGGQGGSTGKSNGGASGSGGHGGGSVFGGLSSGGAAGFAEADVTAAVGGAGGTVNDNKVSLSGITLQGGAGGDAGTSGNPGGGGGAGGHGGGSVFGGLSSGGAGGMAESDFSNLVNPPTYGNGGAGGSVSGNTVTLRSVTLRGAQGGEGGTSSLPGDGGIGGSGAGGHGGGSVFGGLSSGGAGGSATADSNITFANGGAGGQVIGNTVTLTDVTLQGATPGNGGIPEDGGQGLAGQQGGSVFGGFSSGGAGGVSYFYSTTRLPSADGGAGGDVLKNFVTIGGVTSIPGNVYGGYSQGGGAGLYPDVTGNVLLPDRAGVGGLVQNNTVTLNGSQITINGSIYGGYSVNGAGVADDSKAFTGNTLNLNGYKGAVQGIYNFENYNWVLPSNVKNQDALITVTNPVDLHNTKHSIGIQNDANSLQAGDTITLINKASGAPLTTPTEMNQGHFLTYDVTMGVTSGNEFVLTIIDATPSDPVTRINPKAKAFLEGRAANLAMVNQGADMISESGIDAARASLRANATNMFVAVDGGSSRYKTGSHIKVHDFKLALGVAKALELDNKSALMLGVFAEHGNGNYDSYNDFGSYGEVRGWGKLRYSGVGAMFHMDVAGTGAPKTEATPAIFDSKDGLYLNAAVRAGQSKVSFDSNDLIDPSGMPGHYDSKSKYLTAMAGLGYVWNLDAKQAVEIYGRYTWGRLKDNQVQVGKDLLGFGTAHSQRIRIGARYGYVYTPQITPLQV